MKKTLRHPFSFLVMALCQAILLSFFWAASASTWSGITTGLANVRAGPTAGAARVTTYQAGTHVTVYAAVHGQIVWEESLPGIASPVPAARRAIFMGHWSCVQAVVAARPRHRVLGRSSWSTVPTTSSDCMPIKTENCSLPRL